MIINNVEMQNLYVAQENLNIRSGPGTNYTIIGGCYKYSLVDVQYIDNGFAYIGKGQWICSKYLKRYTDGLEDNMQGWKMTTMHNLNMRKGPGTQYRSLGILKKGKTVEVIKEQNNWFQVKYKNKTFWLSGMYLK